MLPRSWHSEIRYLIEDEFANRIVKDGKRMNTEVTSEYNDDIYNPLDGAIVRACDRLAAYTEASLSIRHGIKSKHLNDGLSIYKEYEGDKGVVSGADFRPVFDHFHS